MIRIILLILFSAIMVSIAQVLFKKGVGPHGTPNMRSASSYGRFMGRVLATPTIWLGFGAMTVGVVVWLIALAQSDLSVAFPLESMQFVVIMIAARIFLGEKIDARKVLGTLMVAIGIILISMS